MFRFFSAFFLANLLLFSGYLPAQDLNTLPLDGNWKFRKEGTEEWMPASVPGVVHLDLMRNKVIPDPCLLENEATSQWIGDVGWEYVKSFEYGAENFSWRHIDLVFKGLDTYARVYLNDSLVLVANNMFREWIVDVKFRLYIGTNTLRVVFPAVNPQIKRLADQLPQKLPGDEKVVCRKAAYHFGWDWGPKLVTSGIWKSVYLRPRSTVQVADVQFIQKSLTDSIADLTAKFTILAELDDSVNIRLFLDSTEIVRDSVLLSRKVNVVKTEISIPNPARWWPNGMGKPTLYNFSYEVYARKRLIAKGQQRIGLRTIELIQEKDTIGQSFYFKVNDIPVFIRGANYIPQDNFLPRVKASAYRALIGDVKAANMNMLRVWGGGIYENDIFYDLCDENGIMVWQDFMFACAMYPANNEFLDNVREEAIQNITRLRRHPSLALWCGNNEIDEGWKNWGWQKQYNYSAEDSAVIYKNYEMIFNTILPDLVRKFDLQRPYIASSPLHGWGRRESMTTGDSHYWGVWWGKEPFSVYEKKVGRFMSEFGFQGFPDFTTIREFTSPGDRTLGSGVMKAHQKHPIGYETIDEYLLRDYKKPKDFESYAYVSQLLQAKGIKLAIEAQRRAAPKCMGTLYWQLNDCWPGVSWSSRDYYGKKKALHFALPAVFNNILVSPVVEDGHVRVYISSDEFKVMKGTLAIKLIDFKGNAYFIQNQPVEISGKTSVICFDTVQSALLGNLNPGSVLLRVTLSSDLFDRDRQNLLYFVSPKELLLTTPFITKKVTETKTGYTIELSSDKLAKNVFISPLVRGDLSDNYFDLLPGEARQVNFTTPKKFQNMADLIIVKSLTDSY